MSNLQRKRIIEYLKQGKRFDGRKPEEYRKIEIKTGISNKAEGSVSVKFGNTEVYAGIKLEVIKPYPDSLDSGVLTTSSELNPMASPDFEMGPPKIEAIELARIVDRGVRESGFIDFKKLCIKEGEKVWGIYLDIYAVNDSGNLVDVAALAALIALANAKMPVYNEKTERVEHEWTKESLPLNKDAMAFNMTIHRIDGVFIFDPVKEEQEISDFRISIAASLNKGKARISSIQKGKEGTISSEEMEKVLNLVEDKIKEIYPQIIKYSELK
ncbi:MAG: RNA-binding protein [Nanoarchaeota archaeon]|nr:RNA-binding protein [Nanoarchaeota archaeon]